MNIETILDAMVMADRRRLYPIHNPKILLYPNAERQYNAFRARILRMYRERDRQTSKSFELWVIERGIANDLRRQLAEKDARIAELEAEFNHYQDQYHE